MPSRRFRPRASPVHSLIGDAETSTGQARERDPASTSYVGRAMSAKPREECEATRSRGADLAHDAHQEGQQARRRASAKGLRPPHFAGFEGRSLSASARRHSFRRPAMIALVSGSLASHCAGYNSFSYPMLTVQGVLAGLFSEPLPVHVCSRDRATPRCTATAHSEYLSCPPRSSPTCCNRPGR